MKPRARSKPRFPGQNYRYTRCHPRFEPCRPTKTQRLRHVHRGAALLPNPTGFDLSPADWRTCCTVRPRTGADLDMAYRFGTAARRRPADVCSRSGLPSFCPVVSNSFRCTANVWARCHRVDSKEKRAHRSRSRCARTNYSNPRPTRGMLQRSTTELLAQWEAELSNALRTWHALEMARTAKAAGPGLQLRRPPARDVLLLRPDR